MCQKGNFDNLQKILLFFMKHKIYIPPLADEIENKSVFDIALNDKFILTALLEYYNDKNFQ